MANIVYNRFLANLMNKLIDLGNGGDTLKCALLSNTYTPDKDHDVWADVSAHEVSGTGYVADGATLGSQAVAQNDTTDKGTFDADDVLWSSSTITARYAVIYDDTLASDDLICLFDFAADKTSENGDFKIQWNALGILNLG